MGPWVIPAISTAASAVQSYLASRRQKRGYEMSPYEEMIMGALLKEYQGEVPSAVTAPFYAQAKSIEQQHAREPGSSAIVPALKEKFAYTPMAEAVKGYKQSLLPMMAGLARGTGTEWAQGGLDIGMPLEDLGWMLFQLTQGGKKPGEVTQEQMQTPSGGGMQHTPGFLSRGFQDKFVPQTGAGGGMSFGMGWLSELMKKFPSLFIRQKGAGGGMQYGRGFLGG